MKYIAKIGMDHGYRNMKTRNCLFDTAISELPGPGVPDELDGILKYKGSAYTLYGKRVASVDTHNKADSKEFYLLTLAAMAKEMQARKVNTASVYLSAGLPQRWYLAQKEAFADMLGKEKHLEFEFEGNPYAVDIENVRIYIQGYAAAISLLMKKYQSDFVVIVDIGGETMDIIPVNATKIVREDCRIATNATIWLMKDIAERINTELYADIPDAKVLEYLVRSSKEKEPGNPYEKIMHHTAREYCSRVYQMLREYKLNPELVPVIFVGGGAGIMKRFGEYNPDMTDFIEDLRANAIGYELLDEIYYSRR